MFTGFPFLIVGIIGLLFHRSYVNDTRIDLSIHEFWETFNKKYPKDLKDAVHRSSNYKYDISFLYKLSSEDAYKKLSNEQSEKLILKFKEIKLLQENLSNHERLEDYCLYIGAGGIAIFIFSIFFYSVN